jgi:hypothetical protein
MRASFAKKERKFLFFGGGGGGGEIGFVVTKKNKIVSKLGQKTNKTFVI